jgi:hypothetical protein
MLVDFIKPKCSLPSSQQPTISLYPTPNESCPTLHNVTDLLKAFVGNGSVNTVRVQQWEMYLSGRRLLRVVRQQRTNEEAG